MIILPKEKPIVKKLNSYYLRIPKLVEHYQGEIGSGVVHFKSPAAKGLIVFDKDELLNGAFQQKGETITGPDAVDALLNTDENASYNVSVFSINADEIYYWSTIPDAKRIYQDLSTEFTDLEGLIKKMRNEELTGVIEVVIGKGAEGALLLMNAGRIIGGSYSWGDASNPGTQNDQKILFEKTQAEGGTFHVSRLPSSGTPKTHSKKVGTKKNKAKIEPATGGTAASSARVTTSLEELLGIFERIIQSRKGTQGNFQTALNRKFVEKADKYLFLDPFAAEFRYANRKISVLSDVTDQELWAGLIECVSELADELGLKLVLQENLVAWKKKYQNILASFGARI